MITPEQYLDLMSPEISRYERKLAGHLLIIEKKKFPQKQKQKRLSVRALIFY